MRIDQADWKSPTLMNGSSGDGEGLQPPQVYWMKIDQARTQARNSKPVVMACEAMSPSRRPNRPTIERADQGAKTRVSPLRTYRKA